MIPRNLSQPPRTIPRSKVFLDKNFKRNAHPLVDNARTVDPTADAEKLGAPIILPTKACEAARATAAYHRRRDRRGTQTDLCRFGEWELETRYLCFLSRLSMRAVTHISAGSDRERTHLNA